MVITSLPENNISPQDHSDAAHKAGAHQADEDEAGAKVIEQQECPGGYSPNAGYDQLPKAFPAMPVAFHIFDQCPGIIFRHAFRLQHGDDLFVGHLIPLHLFYPFMRLVNIIFRADHSVKLINLYNKPLVLHNSIASAVIRNL